MISVGFPPSRPKIQTPHCENKTLKMFIFAIHRTVKAARITARTIKLFALFVGGIVLQQEELSDERTKTIQRCNSLHNRNAFANFSFLFVSSYHFIATLSVNNSLLHSVELLGHTHQIWGIVVIVAEILPACILGVNLIICPP